MVSKIQGPLSFPLKPIRNESDRIFWAFCQLLFVKFKFELLVGKGKYCINTEIS